MIKYKNTVPVPSLEMVDDILSLLKCSPQSVQINIVINSSMETKKVTLNKTKCHNLHIGKKKQCPDLKVHGEKINKADQIKYIGGEINKTGKAKATIEKNKSQRFWLGL